MDPLLVAAVHAHGARHDGAVLLGDIRALGGTAQTARSLVRAGHLLAAGPGIYLEPGHPPGPRTALRVALGRAGPSGVASHRTAAWLLGLVDAAPAVPTVSVPRQVSARRATILPVKVVRTGLPLEPIMEQGFPVTSAARTIVDVASIARPTTMSQLIDRAFERRVATVATLQRELARQVGRPGVRALAATLAARGPLDLPGQSILEAAANRLVGELCGRLGLPLPVREQRVLGGRFRIDHAWPDVRLAIEVDGYRWHGSKAQRDHDYDRRSELAAHEWVTVAFSWEQVVDDPATVADRIAATYRWLAALRCGRP